MAEFVSRRDSAVEHVQDDGNADGLGGMGIIPIHCGQNGIVAAEDVPDRKEAGKDKNTAARGAAGAKPRHPFAFSCDDDSQAFSQNGASALDPVADPDQDLYIVGKDHIHPRAEPNQSDQFSTAQHVPRLLPANDATGNQACDLFDDYLDSLAVDGDDVLFVERAMPHHRRRP